ncbi:hypothetical protein [uncultured Senegalimassilia sp.]|uniref:Uncharacterized protein n=1 Tax=Siphoviridae sp. ctqBc4 TaxID=2827945 RepID=A0A8S5SD11_9CAUD|nr:hypothetical protein [uncultured Senegalimassilia sp.]DAF48618.1 MAG TPA: hypothetical protein [Siphoviridae sp. ctqBc4]
MNAPEYMALANEAEELFDVQDRMCQSCGHFVVMADGGMRHTIGFCDLCKGVSYDRETDELHCKVNDLYWATHEDNDGCGRWELSEDWA